jgi:oligopeptide/dipeptide ABC transporter ATP-binding protein
MSSAAASFSELLLEVSGLEVHFGAGSEPVRAVDGVSLQLHRGETLGLVGESGCGKSTLARAIAGLAPVRSGSVRLDGCELVGLSRRALRKQRPRLQMVFQDPLASLNPRLTVSSLVGEALVLHEGLSGAELDRRVGELLEQVGLEPDRRRQYPHQFSGGQRQRICIARALAAGPELLLCDEVTSALDVSIQAQILNLLTDLQDQLGIAMLFITHDLGVVRYVAQRVAVMYLGQVVEERATAELFEAPAHPYTQALLAAAPSLSGDTAPTARVHGDVPSPARPPSGCRFHTRCPRAEERCSKTPPAAVPVPGGHASCLLL